MGRRKQLSKERVMEAISGWFLGHGLPPTIEELRQVLGLGSTRTVLRYLRWLEEEGHIERWPGARGLRLLKASGRGTETRAVPVVGVVAAGLMLLAEENIDGWVQVPKKMAPERTRYFLLRVRGDSMNNARVAGEKIEDGDLVLVRQRATADDGEIVVALVNGEATIKRFARGPGYYVLKPDSSNPKHRPIVVDRDFRIQGVVVRVLKKASVIID